MLPPVDGHVQSTVSHRGIDPSVEAVTKIGDTGVRVAQADAGPEHVLPVGLSVPVFIAEQDHVRSVGGNRPAGDRQDGGADVEAPGKDSDRIGPAVAVADLQDLDAILRVPGPDLMGIVEGLHHPEPSLLVPVHGDGIDHHGLGREEADFEARGHLGELEGIFRREGILDLVEGADRVVGVPGCGRRPVVQFREISRCEPAHGVVPGGPAEGPVQKIVILGHIPATVIVPTGSVEDPSLAVGLDPGPRFLVAFLEDDAVLAMALVFVGLVPALEALPPLHHRMVLVHDAGPENSLSVPLELGSEKLDVFGEIRLPEAGGRAVQQHAASALACEVEEGLTLGLHVELVEVGEDDEDIVLGQVLLGERFDGVGVGHVDRLRAQGLAQHPEAGRGIVIEEVLAAQEEHLDAAGSLSPVSLAGLAMGPRDESLQEQPGTENQEHKWADGRAHKRKDADREGTTGHGGAWRTALL